MTDIIDIFETGLKEPRWVCLGFFIISLLFPLISIPINTPPTAMTTDYYNVVVSVEAGDVILFDGTQWTLAPGIAEFSRKIPINYWRQKGACVVWILGPTSQGYDLLFVKRMYDIPEDADISKHPDYGKLFVIMPGTWATNPYLLAANFRGAGSYDIFGNSFDDLPGIKDVKNGFDIKVYHGGPLGGPYTTAFTSAQYGTMCIATGDGGALAVQSSFYATGLIKGVLIGLKGASEFNQMLGLTDTPAQKASLTEIAIGAYTILLTLLYNVINFYSMRTRRRFLSVVREIK